METPAAQKASATGVAAGRSQQSHTDKAQRRGARGWCVLGATLNQGWRSRQMAGLMGVDGGGRVWIGVPRGGILGVWGWFESFGVI